MRYADTVFVSAETQAEFILRDTQTSLGNFAQTIRGMIMREDSAEDLEKYMTDLTDYMKNNSAHRTGTNTLYGYFECFSSGEEKGERPRFL